MERQDQHGRHWPGLPLNGRLQARALVRAAWRTARWVTRRTDRPGTGVVTDLAERSAPRRGTRLVLAAGAGALALTAGLATPLDPAPQTAAAASGGDSKTLTVAIDQSIDSFSPFLAVRLASTSILRLAYENLTSYDAGDAHTIPGLATHWKSSPDKLTWTYTIRKGVKWSDGQPVTAEDVSWTYNKMMTDRGAATANGSYVANFKSVTAASPTQLVIKLKKPSATMLAIDVPVVPKHVWSKVKDFTKFNNDKTFPIVGDGPFVITGYKADSYVKLKPNKHFYRGAPKFDQLVFKYYKDNDAAVEALKKGEVSFVQDLTPAQAASLSNAENIKVNDAPGRRFWSLATNPGARAKNGKKFGNGDPSLLDERVRHALFMAVDRKTILDRVLQGHGVGGEGYIPPRFSTYFWKPSADQELRYDPKKAAQLLDEAGYKKNGQGKRVGKDGKPLNYRLLCHATDPKDKATSKYLKEWYGELGIGLTVDCLDNVTDPWLAGEYDLAFDGWSVNPDPDYVLSIHTCDALPATPKDTGATDNFICDKKYDDLYAKQMAEYDPAKRADLVKQMESRLYDLGYMNVMAYPNVLEAYRTDQIKSITTMPEKAGNIYGQDGYWSWWSAVPADSDGSSGSSSSTGVIIGVVVAVVVLAGVGGFVMMRRRSTAEERE